MLGVDVPKQPSLDLAGTQKEHGRSWLYGGDIFVWRAFRVFGTGKVTGDVIVINVGAVISQRKEGWEFRGPQNPFRGDVVEQRTDPKRIARKKKPSLPGVPQGQRVIADQAAQEIEPPFAVGRRYQGHVTHRSAGAKIERPLQLITIVQTAVPCDGN